MKAGGGWPNKRLRIDHRRIIPILRWLKSHVVVGFHLAKHVSSSSSADTRTHSHDNIWRTDIKMEALRILANANQRNRHRHLPSLPSSRQTFLAHSAHIVDALPYLLPNKIHLDEAAIASSLSHNENKDVRLLSAIDRYETGYVEASRHHLGRRIDREFGERTYNDFSYMLPPETSSVL
ncbi:hypothetical protein BDR22DRAFT_281228 [Usnea florida]